MTFDRIEKIGHSVIQHGTSNDRVYLMKLDPKDSELMIRHIEKIMLEHQYSKVFAKVPAECAEVFQSAGYEQEAKITGFFKGRADALFMSRFYSKERRSLDTSTAVLISKVRRAAFEKAGMSGLPKLPNGLLLQELNDQDVNRLVDLYRIVFPSYPFPIYDPDYIRSTMRDHIRYFGIYDDERLVAASSAELDVENNNAEMTDFATHPDARGRGLALNLLQEMEIHMPHYGISTLYTIARALSYGMNITFAKQNYTFGGTLVNNTQIAGGLESMNVWYKPLNV